LRNDLVVRLPNNRVIAIDAKVPLSDYTVAANETDDKRCAAALDMHAKTVRRHVESLSRREYHASIGETLDFVVLFVPGEHFLSAALMTDPTLFDFAAVRRVYLASATILLPLLRAVSAGWKAERTEESSVTSTTAVRTSQPPSDNRPAASASRSAWMSASVTLAPHSASTSAAARPRPLAAPVTRARLPRTSKRRAVTAPGSTLILPAPAPSSRPPGCRLRRRWRPGPPQARIRA
jgi:hypothetical protein